LKRRLCQSRRPMEGPNADSGSNPTQERLIVKVKRPSRKRWALLTKLRWSAARPSVQPSRRNHGRCPAFRRRAELHLYSKAPKSLGAVMTRFRDAVLAANRRGNPNSSETVCRTALACLGRRSHVRISGGTEWAASSLRGPQPLSWGSLTCREHLPPRDAGTLDVVMAR
jgi:hypothetical protein